MDEIQCGIQCYWCLAAAIMLVAGQSCTIASGKVRGVPSVEGDESYGRPGGPLCGVYCLYAALRFHGRQLDVRELIDPAYIGSAQGSSIRQLQDGAEHYGLYTAPLSQLTIDDLKKIGRYPTILHVKSTPGSKTYGHYVLLLGTAGGRAKILNPPRPIRMVEFGELMPIWDGAALVLSTRPIDVWSLRRPAIKRFFIRLGCVLCVVADVNYVRRTSPARHLILRLRSGYLSLVGAASLIGASLLFGFGSHILGQGRFFDNPAAVQAVQEVHAADFIPKEDLRGVRRLLNGDTIFVDARFGRDYERAHFPGAISLPVDINDIEWRQRTAALGRDARIVVYCQSVGCPFAGVVARKLMGDGFRRVSIYRAGWAEWRHDQVGGREDSEGKQWILLDTLYWRTSPARCVRSRMRPAASPGETTRCMSSSP